MQLLEPLFWLIDTVLDLLIILLFASVIMSWLISFKVINTSNRLVYLTADFLYRVTEPALRPIRRFLPTLGGIDLSPIVLILLLFFAKSLLFEYMPH
mgnify:CR=1 FL=1